MSQVNLSIKLLKEVFIGMGGGDLIQDQEALAQREVQGAQTMLRSLDSDLDNFCSQILGAGIQTVEEFKSRLRTLNFETMERNREKLIEQIHESEGLLNSSKAQHKWIDSLTQSVFSPEKIDGFWKAQGFQLYANHDLDLSGLESSLIDYFAVSRNKKRAYFILLELNRNAPESNVLKLYYYLKNSRSLWNFENLVILQIFSPKYLIEKKGKSLALAREMALFLGHEFSGGYVFGDKRVKVRYESEVFSPGQYEVFSVFWNLMSDESDSESRYEVLCEKLAQNSKFLELCKQYVRRQAAQNLQIEEPFTRLAGSEGTSLDIHQIFCNWCWEIVGFIRDKFQHYEGRN